MPCIDDRRRKHSDGSFGADADAALRFIADAAYIYDNVILRHLAEIKPDFVTRCSQGP